MAHGYSCTDHPLNEGVEGPNGREIADAVCAVHDDRVWALVNFAQGGKKSLSALRLEPHSRVCLGAAQHVALLKSGSDANTYLVGDASDPLQRSLMDLELKDHLLASGHPHALAAGENAAPSCWSSRQVKADRHGNAPMHLGTRWGAGCWQPSMDRSHETCS
jgi:hypothetical protein